MLQDVVQIPDTFEATPTLSTPVVSRELSSGMDMTSILLDNWSMIVLILLLLVVLYLFMQRYLYLKNAMRDEGTFMNRIKDYLTEGKVESALKACKNMNTPSSRVIGKGITVLGRPLPDVLQVMNQLRDLEIKRLRRKADVFRLLNVLAICIAALGVVVWMGQLFYLQGGMLDGANLMTPINSLVTGILSATLIYVAFYTIDKQVSMIEIVVDSRVIEFTNFLNKPAT